MITLTLKEIAEALNARLVGDDVSVSAVSTDTRKIQSECLFIALRGERFDAHDFIDSAISNGAKAVLVSQPLDITLPQLIVEDTRIALGRLGAYVRAKLKVITVAITGSNGKTSVKEMLATILKQSHQVLYTAGNFNNDIGAPLTLLRLSENDQYGVFELGANHKGEIDYTSALVKPHVALVNNVGEAHIEGFGSIDDVAIAKSEIYQHLTDNGIAIINADDAYAEHFKAVAQKHKQLCFGIKNDADVKATDISANKLGQYQFTLCYQEQREQVLLPLNGKHHVYNALAAASMAIALGLSLADIVSGLHQVSTVSGRMQPHQIEHVQLIDDSYNANPSSVRVAIDWLRLQQGEQMLVLGDFSELGMNTEKLHREIGEYAKINNISEVMTLGDKSQATSEQFGGKHFTQLQALVDAIQAKINQQQTAMTILVKGSRSAAMERVVNAIKSAYERGEWK
ncbi:UDP-N-acetylmuramoyl-tripeptide--D-alanyl-D-alanine ligase [Parashewanella curva]|uniref:UDP-N-acetylmuramoyl-tripeptide--D-alanyl-D-alanine ligase n=1 Tax=Parashewanella curva TaxID=2338552 RepID=A0A3L8PUF3_9GAMM|nr:UDP-N-acetylmuramoyl-tripeptide--D-alanyl-D-alanine ligase [Parashewanella curva]RLV58950.1 UDP-N-acetylmuramoyl-tripeptide--D-alanyl-D-alanine ligase [Parashewanella curva]